MAAGGWSTTPGAVAPATTRAACAPCASIPSTGAATPLACAGQRPAHSRLHDRPEGGHNAARACLPAGRRGLATSMNIHYLQSSEDVGRVAAADAAQYLRDVMRERGAARIIAATGASQINFLAHLV